MKANRRFRLIVVGVLLLGGCESQRQLSMRPSPGQTEFLNQDLQWIRSEKVHSVSVCLSKKMIEAGENASFQVFVRNQSLDTIVFGPEKISIAAIDGSKWAKVLTYEELAEKVKDVAGRVGMNYAAAGHPQRSLELMQMVEDTLAKGALKAQTVLPGYLYGGFVEAKIPSLNETQRDLDMTVTVGGEEHVFRINIAANGRNGFESSRLQGKQPQSPPAPRSPPSSPERSTLTDEARANLIDPPPHTEEHRLDMAIAQEKLRCIQLCRDYGLNPEPIIKESEDGDAYYQRQYGERWRERRLADWQHDRQELERYLRELAANQAKQRTQQQK